MAVALRISIRVIMGVGRIKLLSFITLSGSPGFNEAHCTVQYVNGYIGLEIIRLYLYQ